MCVCLSAVSDPNGRSKVLFAVEQPPAQPGERHDGPAEQRDVRGRHHRGGGTENPSAQSCVVRLQQLFSSELTSNCSIGLTANKTHYSLRSVQPLAN